MEKYKVSIGAMLWIMVLCLLTAGVQVVGWLAMGLLWGEATEGFIFFLTFVVGVPIFIYSMVCMAGFTAKVLEDA